MRPTGVTLIAVIYFLAAGFLSLLGFGLVLGTGIAALTSTSYPFMGLAAGIGAIGAVIVFILVAVSVAVAIGLLRLRNWARTVAVVLAVIFGLGNASAAIAALMVFEPLTFLWNSIQLAIDVWIVWYMMQPHVRRVFAA